MHSCTAWKDLAFEAVIANDSLWILLDENSWKAAQLEMTANNFRITPEGKITVVKEIWPVGILKSNTLEQWDALHNRFILQQVMKDSRPIFKSCMEFFCEMSDNAILMTIPIGQMDWRVRKCMEALHSLLDRWKISRPNYLYLTCFTK